MFANFRLSTQATALLTWQRLVILIQAALPRAVLPKENIGTLSRGESGSRVFSQEQCLQAVADGEAMTSQISRDGRGSCKEVFSPPHVEVILLSE